MITDVNSAAVRILGYHAEELLGQWFPAVIRAIDSEDEAVDMLERPIMQAMVTGKPIVGRTFYVTKAQQRLPVSITVSPILVDDRPVGAIEVFRDISKEHEVDRMKSEFISIASHQLRTPLTAIKTYSHMLAGGFGGKLNQHQQDFMNIILGSVDRMNELINTLLDISRIEEGRMTIAPQSVDLRALVNEIVTELTPMAADKNLTISCKLPAKGLRLTSDPLLIKEVCANLLSNAIKYTPDKGKIDLEINVTSREFVFTIADNGYGIPYAEQKRVFTKFFRAENVLDKEAGGTGLGLYLVKQVVENLGGKINFISKEGQGSAFTFTLPRKK